MRPTRVAIVGFGRLGRACARIIRDAPDMDLAVIVRRPESLNQPLPAEWRQVGVVTHIGELNSLDAALLCLPKEVARETARELFQHGLPLVDCTALHGAELLDYKKALDRVAVRHHVAAIIGAGWDPGALSLFRGMFQLLAPTGQTQTHERPGINLHHTLSAKMVQGIRDALCIEHRAADASLQRYLYVELSPGADFDDVAQRLRADPLFLDVETLVFPVDSLAALEDEGHGIVMARRGTAGPGAHQLLLLEARFDLRTLAAQIMVSAARALPLQAPGAHSLWEIPLGTLWGDLRGKMEGETI